MNKKFLLIPVFLGITIIILSLSIITIYPLEPVDSKLHNGNEFNVSEATVYLEKIASHTHATGSKQHTEVKDYITSVLTELHIDWEIQEALFYNESQSELVRVKNIIATLPGNIGDQTLAISAHYDSVPTGPGASDDGLSVAAMLQVIKQLRNESTFDNNVLFIITDGEERGLHGMEAFKADHPLGDSIDFMINFEARGTYGVPLMFETTPNNLNTIKSLKSSTKGIVSNSTMSDIYNSMDNDTDFTVYKREGVQGLNFAFVGGGHNYHTVGDNLKNISNATFLIQGNHMLNTTKYYGNYDLTSLYTDNDSTFFSVFNRWLVVYSNKVSLIIKILALFLAFWAIFEIFKKKKASMAITGICFIVQLCIPIVLYYSLPFLLKGFRIFGKPIYIRLNTVDYNSIPLFIGLVLFVSAIISLVYLFGSKKANATELSIGILLIFIILSIGTIFTFTGSSYLFDYIILAEGIILLVQSFKSENKNDSLLILARFIPFWIGLILLLPMLMLVTDSFFIRNFNLGAILVFLLTSLYLPKLYPLISKKYLVSVLLIILTSIAIIIEYPTTQVKTDTKQNTIIRTELKGIFYGRNSDGSNEWVTYGLDPTKYDHLREQSKTEDIPLPSITIVKDEDFDDQYRKITLQFDQSLPSSIQYIEINNEQRFIQDAILNNTIKLEMGDMVHLETTALDKGDCFITLVCIKEVPIKVRIYDDIYTLSEVEGYGIYDTIMQIDEAAIDEVTLTIKSVSDFVY